MTRPHRSASSASTTRPVRISSSALPIPTIAGSRWVPPSMSGTPKRRSVNPRRAVVVAIRRSHHRASSSPPARHHPEIAASVGLDGVRRVNPIGPSVRAVTASTASAVTPAPASAMALRSAPAQNASGPSPVRTRTRASSSASKSRNPSSRRAAVSMSTALRRSRRSIVSTAAAPARSYRTLGMPGCYSANLRWRAQALQLAAEPLLATLEPDLDQREDGDQQHEEDHQRESPVGDDLVVGPPPESDAIRRQRRRRQRHQGSESRGDRKKQPGGPSSAHGRNSTVRVYGEPPAAEAFLRRRPTAR